MFGRKKKTKEVEEEKKDAKAEANSFLDENIKEVEELAEQVDKPQTDEQKIQQAEEEVKKSKSYKALYFYSICFVINIVGFSIFLVLTSPSKVPFKDLIQGPKIFFVAAFFCFVFLTLVESLRVSIMLFKSTKKPRPIMSYNSAAISRYYDLITPISKTGGQSHQITYLYKSGIKGNLAASVPIAKNAVASLCYLVFIVILLFAKPFGIITGEAGAVSVLAYIGLGLQFLWLGIVIFLSVSKKIGPAITIGVLKVAAKLRIINDYKVVYIKVLHFVNDYQTSMRKLFKDPLTLFGVVFSSFGLILLRFSIPFFLYCSFFDYNSAMFVPILARIVLCELAMSIPLLPGNVIIADLAFYSVFKSVFLNGTLFWALLFWRLITYYLLILQGMAVLFVVKVRRFIKKKKQEKETLKQYYDRD